MSYISNNSFGTLSSAPDNCIIDCIFEYLSITLRDFKGNKDENENGITDRLCKKLEYLKPSEYPFFFHHQNIEDVKDNTSTDFAAFGSYSYTEQFNDEPPTLIKFEAKRLTNKLSKKREKEYVIGEYHNNKQIRNSGGIERFKNGRHGDDVIHACIIGYVQHNSFSFWEEKINGWIQDEIFNPHDSSLSWGCSDILELAKSECKISEYISAPKRKSGNPIFIRHIWVNLI